MNSQIKQRLFITVVVTALLWIMCAGIYNLINLAELQINYRNNCIDQNIKSFAFCTREAERNVTPTLMHYLSPYIPIIVLLWLKWVFKFNFQIELDNEYKKTKLFILLIVYSLGILGIIFPIFIVLYFDKYAIHHLSIRGIFELPLLLVSWILTPILFQKLVDIKNKFFDFNYIKKIIYVVIASTLIALLFLIVRLTFNI